MATVGYGDIVPSNSREKILAIFTILSACCMFGYSLNTIGQIVQDFSKTEDEIKKNMYIFKNKLIQIPAAADKHEAIYLALKY